MADLEQEDRLMIMDAEESGEDDDDHDDRAERVH